MTPSCYTCKHCNTKGHLAKDCTELREENVEGFEGVSSNADLLLMDNSEDEEEEEGLSGFNDIRMIFDDDTEEEEGEGEEDKGGGEEGEGVGEGNSSKSFEEERVELTSNMAEDSKHENNPNMQRYALLAIIHIYTMLCLAFGIGHFVNVNFFETLQLNMLCCLQGFAEGRSDSFRE